MEDDSYCIYGYDGPCIDCCECEMYDYDFLDEWDDDYDED